MKKFTPIFLLLAALMALPTNVQAVSLGETVEQNEAPEGFSILSTFLSFAGEGKILSASTTGLDMQGFGITMSVLFAIIAFILLLAVIILFVGIYKGKIKLKP